MAKLIIATGKNRGTEFPLAQTQTIGRLGRNEIPIDDDGASRRHARVARQDGDYFVIDLNSKNGVTVNGKKIHKARLEHDDEVGVGYTLFRFECLVSEKSAATPGKITSDSAISYGGGSTAPNRLVTSARKQAQVKTQTLLWLRGDFAQIGGAYKALLVIGLMAIVVGLAYLAFIATAG